jgi:Galactose oxidase, central domain
MRWLTGTVLAIAGVVALSGCGGGSASVQPPSPTPSPAPTPSAGSVTINSLSPNTATAGSADLILTMTGTNLDLQHTGSLQETHTFAIWSVGSSQTSLTATVVSSTQVTAVVPSALLAAVVNAQISVQKWYKADDAPFAVSNSLVFAVTTGPAPSVVPAADVLGTNGTRQFAASGFVDDSKVTWSIEEGQTGGTITPNGFYTAPDRSGTFHIVVTSPSTPSTTANALVTVTSSGFVPTGTMHVERIGHTATLLKDGKVLIVGGGDATAELFDPASGTSSFTGVPVMGRLGATATLLSDGRVLIAGGLGLTAGPDGHLPLLNTAEIFDPATGTFGSTGTMVQARQQHIATLLEDGKVLIAGGYFGYICFTASAELFDPATGTFSPTGFMLSERVGHTATLLASGEVLVVGGSNGCAPDAADDPPWDPLFAELYEPNSGSFQGAGNMSTTRIHHATVRSTNGKVLVLGGIPSLQNLHEQPPNPSYAEVYDRVADSFSPITGLTISPARYTATLMSSGMVLIVGGKGTAGTSTTEVQLLDPSSGVLTPTGALGTARVGHTATLLQDGRVLVAGGTDANGNALATAELYK